jgi:hypothetical protein
MACCIRSARPDVPSPPKGNAELQLRRCGIFRLRGRDVGALIAERQREQLLEMAQTWDKLAAERADLVRRHPELAIGGEHAEEASKANKSFASAEG